MPRPNSLLALPLLLLMSLGLHALPEDRQQPINIQADKAEQRIKEQQEITVYTGNVIMTQGSLLIEGDKITIFSKDRAVQRIVAVGDRAHFQQQTAEAETPVKAYADRIDYNLNKEAIAMIGNADLTQENKSKITAKRIDYNMITEQSKAVSEGSSRVNITLEPKQQGDS